MPSRVSAARSDCGTGGGGGVSGQIAETHTSSRLLGVAQHLDEIRVRHQPCLASVCPSSCGGDVPTRFRLSCCVVCFCSACFAVCFVVFALQRLLRCLLLLYDCGLASPRN